MRNQVYVSIVRVLVATILLVPLALLFALHVGGPVVRAVLGPPDGFNQDYVSPEAFYQAIGVQLLCLTTAFFLFGRFMRRSSERPSIASLVSISNPLTLAIGFGLYRVLVNQERTPYEYFVYTPWIVISLASILFVPSMLLGTKVGRGQAGSL
jgi:hypothetical protein